MTLVELFHRAGRRTRTGDFTQLSMSEQSDVLQAINSGLQKVYNLLPPFYKELTEGFVLPPPRVTTIVAAQYSTAVPAATFDPSEIGRSVVLAGDAGWNVVMGTAQLLNPYLGASGTVAATVYGDAVYSLTYPFERIIGNPKFSNQTNGYFFGNQELARQAGGGMWPVTQTVGRPQVWWPMNMGNSQGNNPPIVIKVAPAPDQAYSINVRASYAPKRMLISDYTAATTIPVPDQFIEPGLIPLVRRALMATPVWVTTGDEERIEKRAEEAEEFLKSQPTQQAPNNRIFTPIGF